MLNLMSTSTGAALFYFHTCNFAMIVPEFSNHA